ncbi:MULTISPECIES: PLD nuclease N-terminal domain-containing protein [Solibacillus]|uniref:PLDc_N domain-containing protein n=1 Tax=Solibacillus merdavium TaxID=2762218 RepID=A0ABR8XQW4_9BACL|nr:PLD nuclease N-terminal domain-containing protein [Solibacillus merdavium]MBD8034301.1 PLDc_N domain-containing protein [Solibacillus merdavium]
MEALSNIPWGLIAPLLVLQFVLATVAIVDIVRIHETRGPKWVWIIVSLFVNTLGPIAYFLFGRKNQ